MEIKLRLVWREHTKKSQNLSATLKAPRKCSLRHLSRVEAGIAR